MGPLAKAILGHSVKIETLRQLLDFCEAISTSHQVNGDSILHEARKHVENIDALHVCLQAQMGNRTDLLTLLRQSRGFFLTQLVQRGGNFSYWDNLPISLAVQLLGDKYIIPTKVEDVERPQSPIENAANVNTTIESNSSVGRVTSGKNARKSGSRNKTNVIPDNDVILISFLSKHHCYDHGKDKLNYTPISARELQRNSGFGLGTVSRFFRKRFDGHKKYKIQCEKQTIFTALELLNGDISPKILLQLRQEE